MPDLSCAVLPRPAQWSHRVAGDVTSYAQVGELPLGNPVDRQSLLRSLGTVMVQDVDGRMLI